MRYQAFPIIRPYTTHVAPKNTFTKKLVYTSPQVGLIQLAKRFSLTTLGISSLCSPALLYFWQEPVVADVGVNSTMFIGAAAASACSTGALHFLLSPYINSIHVHVPQDADRISVTPNTVISIETLNIWARPCTTTIRLRDLKPVSESSFLTWTVKKSSVENQYLLEQQKGIPPTIKQTRFWLDKKNGMGDRDTVGSILRVIENQSRPQKL
ncbi:hypothetical protein BDB01DRAFT_59330 [Pilobolus umbonatus]|nr:hypothetical protein BDB01DRAFT_59330 [Pilobolus umbonatus]